MNKRILSLLVLALAAALPFSGCSKRATSVTLAGSTAFQPFAEKLADAYMEDHPEADIAVQGGGSAVGISSAASGAAQIGMADLVVLPPEAAGLTAIVVAKDGIAVVVNPANALKDLRLDQVKGIFDGTIKNWKELGGPDKAITVVSREAGSGTRSSFEKILGGIELSQDAIIQDSNGTIRETVANDASSIGYLSHGMLNEKIKALSVDGQEPTVEAMVSGAYPLVRPIYFLLKGTPSPVAQAFIDYVLSDKGQASIQEDGLLPAK